MERLSFSILGLLISKNSIAKAGKTRESETPTISISLNKIFIQSPVFLV